MKFIYKTLLFSLFTGLVFISCDDFVEEVDIVDPVAEDGEDYQPVDFVNGVYGMHTEFSYAFSYLGITDMISDNSDKGSSPTDSGTDKRALDELNFTSSSVSVTAMWTIWYKTIGRASQTIEIANTFEGQTAVPGARVIGEAKFLRALNYFWLVRSFGAIPIQEISLVERAPVEEVYEYIEQDLLDAIDALPLKSEYANTELGRATKGAAQGLLAKVYLYQEKWQEAADMANTVITSNQYSLDPNYANVWRVTGENGPGSLFEIQARGEIPQHGVQQYSQVQGARGGDNGWGWGFNTPSQNLEDAFNEAGDDIRRDATIIFAGETLFDGRVVDAGVENPRYSEKAYSSANAGQSDGDKNIRVLRYAEVLLIRAEALNELGQSSAALTPLNLVRTRVELPAITATDQAEVRQAIWTERRLELAMEHDRWFDLVRTGQAEAAMAADGKTFITGKHELFPIPNNQLVQTPEMVQNPGY
ncbi:RagB/SusD family nutrient uptake outer membrane protein [Leeuwenhoekiella marinoflava]|uniref:Starch-binding associating with outer membrane n=2 Tax=Leeuwenhoekiella marinoflava TaxID=988 RepID=A0ABY1HP72_9FLAO|nr:RagB/SusD family nutrient uptake outer membrane protein [Leeuwenhoekiella marinoflava]RXG31890.1 putative outer membrane starch-binding protein [Leeuwenhoekiella marinoflava]SHE90547.1 Starch-binding associating with outer membrane [Leeuwenhoekiella marinoflava DSM 3653]